MMEKPSTYLSACEAHLPSTKTQTRTSCEAGLGHQGAILSIVYNYAHSLIQLEAAHFPAL